jgi:hypothetical protein
MSNLDDLSEHRAKGITTQREVRMATQYLTDWFYNHREYVIHIDIRYTVVDCGCVEQLLYIQITTSNWLINFASSNQFFFKTLFHTCGH